MDHIFGQEEPTSGQKVIDLVGTWQAEERIQVERTKKTELILIVRTEEEENIRVKRTEEEERIRVVR